MCGRCERTSDRALPCTEWSACTVVHKELAPQHSATQHSTALPA
jgi:hypothetical protein